jgi:hypothetical protein
MMTTPTWSWRQSPDLMQRLREAQNHPANACQDIMTFVGFMTSASELETHLAHAERRAAAWVPPVRRRRAA